MADKRGSDERRARGGGRGSLGVVVVDAPQMVRAGISLLVSSDPRMDVLVEASRAEEALDAIGRLDRVSDVVAMVGLSLAGEQDSYWLIRAIREKAPTIPILASASNSDEAAISRALFMGADGFVDKDAAPRDFLDALVRAAQGETVLLGVPESWLGVIAEGVERQPELEPVLTERELEVLAVASEGLTARQIGNRLGLRERTVTTHLSRIYKKLGAGSRVAALSVASRSGLVLRAS